MFNCHPHHQDYHHDEDDDCDNQPIPALIVEMGRDGMDDGHSEEVMQAVGQ